MAMQVGQTWTKRQGKVLKTSKWHCYYVKICYQEFCLQTLSVPRSEQFSESRARGKLWAWMLGYNNYCRLSCFLHVCFSVGYQNLAWSSSSSGSAHTRQYESLISWDKRLILWDKIAILWEGSYLLLSVVTYFWHSGTMSEHDYFKL